MKGCEKLRSYVFGNSFFEGKYSVKITLKNSRDAFLKIKDIADKISCMTGCGIDDVGTSIRTGKYENGYISYVMDITVSFTDGEV